MIDWSKPETLRFRDWDAKIIEALVPKKEETLNLNYPVFVFFETVKGGKFARPYAMNGKYSLENKCKHAKDIIQTKKVPLSFWEIVKLIYDNRGLTVGDGDFTDNICEIDIDNQTFTVGVSNYDCEFLRDNFAYTLDGMTWHKFEKDEE